MGIHLARELRTYFQQSGNKHLFPNGLTLNQLAWEMNAIASGEMYPGILSRAINGHRLLTDWQLEAFCKVLNLTEAQRWRLSYAVAQDKCADAGVDVHLGATPPILAIVTKNITRIEQAREQGILHLGLDMLYDLYQWQCQLEGTILSPPVIRMLALMNNEREHLIDAVARSRWPIETNSIAFVDLPPAAELIEYIQSDIRSDVLNQIIYTTAPLSTAERQVWQQRYQQGAAVEQIAAMLQVTDATVESLLLTARAKVIAYLQGEEELPEILE